MPASTGRSAALEVVTRVRERSAYAHETLDAVLRPLGLPGRDAALATRLAYGTIAVRGTLDEAIARVADSGTQLEPRVADALAIGTFEVLFAKTAEHAAVSETVELVRTFRPRAAGLANALMRRMVKAAPTFPWGDPSTDIGALARLHGHPEWLARLWAEELGRETASSLMAANNLPAPLYLADLSEHPDDSAVLTDLTAYGAEPSPGPLPGSIVVGSPARVRTYDALADGRLLVMDAGAQLAVHLCRPLPDNRVVELGAGRGGKSLLMAAIARRSGGALGSLRAVDLHGFKLESLERAAAARGFHEVSTLAGDACHREGLALEDGAADVVLVDAPCSGLGTLRRHPDRRWRARPEEIEALASLGSRLLASASSLVKPGGFVVYSTCTVAQRENAEVIDGFLSSVPGEGFAIDDVRQEVPTEWERFVTPQGWFQSVPEIGGPDGHFIARLIRQ